MPALHYIYGKIGFMNLRFFFYLSVLLSISQKQYAQYTLNNNATQIACNEYRLTDYTNDQRGSVWNNIKINLTQSFDFNFSVFLGKNDSPGADGMAFVLQPISTSVGTSGGGLGFQGVNPSVGITIDTYQNAPDNDPNYDHIAIQLNGNISHTSINNISGPVTAINGNNNIEDDAWHSFRVVWDAPTKTYTAYIDGILRVTTVKDFVTDIFSGDPLVYWGFTASTGGENNYQAFRTALSPSYTFNTAQKKCVNEPITFTNTTISFSPIVNVYWNFGDGSPVVQTVSPVHSYPVAGDYTVTQRVVALDGCEITNTQTVRIGTKPIAGFSNDNYCNLSVVNFTDTSSTLVGTINNWFWDFDNAGLTSTQQNPSTTYSLAGPKTIKLAVKSLEGCLSDTLVKTIQIYAIPLAPSVSATPIAYCQNSIALPLTATGTNLLWYTTATGGTGNITAPIPNTTATGTTTYYVSQKINGCESPRSAIIIIVSSAPPTPVVVSPVVYCQGTTPSMLTATGTNLLWYNSNTGGVGNAIAPTPLTSITGSFYYYVSQTIGTCEGPRAEIWVKIAQIPATAPVVNTPIVYCQGAIATAIPGTGVSYNWSYSPTTITFGGDLPVVPSTSTVGSTTYYMFYNTWWTAGTLSGYCLGPRTPLNVIVNTTPSAPTVTTPVTYCENAPTNSLIATGTNLLWYTTATGGLGSPIAPIPTSLGAGTTIYYVSQRIGNCEGPRAAIDVNIIAPPPAPIVIPKTYCPNDVAVPVTAIGTNLLWYSTATGGVGTTVAPTPSTVIFPTTYNYYVSQSVGTCEGPRALLVVTVDNSLSVNIGIDTTICEGDSVKFIPIVTPTGGTYEWSAIGVPMSSINNRFIKDATASPIDNAAYILKTTLGGCSKEDTINVNVRWKPIVDVGLPKAICLLDSTLLIAVVSHSTGPISSYRWTPIDSLRTDTLMQTWAYPTKSTNYKLTVATTLADYGCVFTSSDSVKLIVQPVVRAFAGNDTIAVKGAAHSLLGSGGLYYRWSSTTALLNNPFVQYPITTLTNDANFYVQVKDAIGCVGYDTVFVKVYNGPTYYVPNAFTPNGDGLNDIFRAIPVGISNTLYFRIFNRNGQLVFETNQYLKGWDGTFNGKPQPMGTYVWMVGGTDRDYKKVELKGAVNLLR
jgi:gliding motility-associated-like protein